MEEEETVTDSDRERKREKKRLLNERPRATIYKCHKRYLRCLLGLLIDINIYCMAYIYFENRQ